MKKLLLVLFICALPFLAYADDTNIDGAEYTNTQVLGFRGKTAAPSVSAANQGRLYYNNTSDTIKVSLNGGAYSDLMTGVTGAPIGASYWVSTFNTSLTNEHDMGHLTSGLLKHTVSAGVSTPATAVEGADYYGPGGTDVAVTDGGTGASTAQAAINTLTNVVAATNEWVFTKDTATGNATFKASGSGSPTDATYWTRTANASLTEEHAISHLTSGILKHTSGVPETAVAGVDYQAAGAYITALTGDITATGPGSVSATIEHKNSGFWMGVVTDETGSGKWVFDTNPLFGGYLDLAAITNPAAPGAGRVRLHALTTNGFSRIEQDNEATTNLTLGRDNVTIAKNTSGVAIAANSPVYVTDSTGNVPNIAKAKADSLTTLPAIGVALDAIADNAFGQVMKLGVISNINTSSFSTGQTVYVSTGTAGALQNTRPSGTSGAYVQRIGTVLVSGSGNGSLLITTAPFVGNEESGTTAATFAANAITGTSVTGTSFVIGANTLDTNEWAFLDGQDQAVKTTSSVVFLAETLGKNGAGGTEGILTLRDGANPGTTATLSYTKWADLEAVNGYVKSNGSGDYSTGTPYEPGGTDVALADGGTGASLADPGANRIFVWDDTDNATKLAVVGSGLSYDVATDTLSATATGGGISDADFTALMSAQAFQGIEQLRHTVSEFQHYGNLALDGFSTSGGIATGSNYTYSGANNYYVSLSSGSPTVEEQYDGSIDNDNPIWGAVGSLEMDGQGFKVSNNISVAQVQLRMYKSGTPGDNITVDIQTDNAGVPSGTPVANGTSTALVANTAITQTVRANAELITFTFPTPPAITAGTQYHLVLYRSGARDTGNYADWVVDTTGPSYANGTSSTRANGTWSAGTDDFAFKVFKQVTIANGNFETVAYKFPSNPTKLGCVFKLNANTDHITAELSRDNGNTWLAVPTTQIGTTGYYRSSLHDVSAQPDHDNSKVRINFNSAITEDVLGVGVFGK
ncbi:MAG: hypothetical protein WC810_02965 [Janthinobacterium sp.]|jgi:hypothetical protein